MAESDDAQFNQEGGLEQVTVAAQEPNPEPDPLPTLKADLVALAIDRRVPSYEAWAMTVPELTKRLEALGG